MGSRDGHATTTSDSPQVGYTLPRREPTQLNNRIYVYPLEQVGMGILRGN